MKKSRIFMATGAFILAIAGVMATRANKKFVQFSTAYASLSQIGGSGVSGYLYIKGTNLFTTQSGPGSHGMNVKLYTIGNTPIASATDLYTATTKSKIAYLR